MAALALVRRGAAVSHAGLNAPRPRLRVGIIVNSTQQPGWVAEAFKGVAASDFAELAAIIVIGAAEPAPPLLWRVYSRIDRRLFARYSNPARPADLRAAFPECRYILIPGDEAARGSARIEACLSDLNLDLAFVFGDVDDSLFVTRWRFGLWRHWFGENFETDPALAGLRAVADGKATTASGLTVRLGPDAPDRIAYESCARTVPFSITRNTDNVLCKTTGFAARALRQLHGQGEAWLAQRPGSFNPLTSTPSRLPQGREAATKLSLLGGRLAYRGLQKLLNIDQWSLAFHFGALDDWRGDLTPFFRLVPPKDRFWADPFALQHDGRYYIFFEELSFNTGKGHIAMMEVRRDGSHSAPQPVLERDYHLSYPFLVEDNGQLFMIPETSQNRTVEIYRCVEFPHRWELEKVLLKNVRACDATVYKAADRWWMFVAIGADGTEIYDELHIYYADNLLGDWQPHDDNPVKSDARSARPAGALFRRNGALLRPAQICAPLYGTGISLNQVISLTPSVYVEREVERILPASKEILGIHTLNSCADLTVTDAFSRRRRF